MLGIVTFSGCTGDPAIMEPACPHGSAVVATPAQLYPCARDAARAWRPDAVLVGAEGTIAAADQKVIVEDERPLDGYTKEWGFTFANVSARVSATFIVHANGSVEEPRTFAWRERDAPKPHDQGYQDALPLAFLETSHLQQAVRSNATASPIADRTTWHAYSLVSVAGKKPAWFVDSGAASPAGYSEIRVDPGAWRVFYVWTG